MIKKLLEKSFKCQETNDLDNALKYAYQAVSISYSPRADACCCVGEIYLSKGNFEWAKFWFEKALRNMNVWIDEELPSTEYFTTIPLMKLAFIEHSLGNVDAAIEYNDAVLTMQPSNEVALSNKEQLIKEKETNSITKGNE